MKGVLNMKRKMLYGFIATLLCVGLIAGCGGGELPPSAASEPEAPVSQAPPGEETAARPQGTLKMLLAPGGLGSAMEKGIELYEAESGNTIEFLSYSNSEMREKQILNLRSNDNQQDIVLIDSRPWLAEQMSFLEPLNSWADSTGMDTGMFVDSYLKMFSQDGVQYALPFRIGGWVLLYRTDLFEAAGLEKTPETMEEFREYAKALTKDGVYGFSPPFKQSNFIVSQYAPFLYSYGGVFLTEDNARAAFNTDAGRQALQLLVDMFNTDKSILPSALDSEHQGVYTSLQQGLAAMALTYSPYYLNVNDPENSKFPGKFDIAPAIPSGVDGKSGIAHFSGWGLGINKKSDQKSLAWDFITFLTCEGIQTTLAVESVNAPTTKATFSDPVYLERFPAAEQVLQAVNTGYCYPALVKWSSIEDVLSRELSSAISQTKTVEQALADAEKDVNAILA